LHKKLVKTQRLDKICQKKLEQKLTKKIQKNFKNILIQTGMTQSFCRPRPRIFGSVGRKKNFYHEVFQTGMTQNF